MNMILDIHRDENMRIGESNRCDACYILCKNHQIVRQLMMMMMMMIMIMMMMMIELLSWHVLLHNSFLQHQVLCTFFLYGAVDYVDFLTETWNIQNFSDLGQAFYGLYELYQFLTLSELF